LYTTGNYYEVTGVQLEKGTTVTPYDIRPYAIELRRCMRYYQVLQPQQFNVSWALATGAYLNTQFPVTMRIAPTRVVSSSGTITILCAANNTSSSCSYTFYQATPGGTTTTAAVFLFYSGLSGGVAGSGGIVTAATTLTIAVNADF